MGKDRKNATVQAGSAALNRWIIDSATDFAIMATDHAGKVTSWSVGAERILGWSAADMLGDTLERIFTPEDVRDNRMHVEMDNAIATGAGNDERWHLRKGGERFWANGEMTPLIDDAGAVVGFVKVLRDRTEQHEAIEALKEEQAGTRRLLDSMAEGFYAVDRDGVTMRCNAAFLRMMGFASEDEVVGRKLHDVIHHSHPDGEHYEVVDCPIYTCARVGTRAHVIDELFFPVSGVPIAVEYWAHPIVREGIVDGAICTFLDITARKRSESALRASQAELRALNQDLENQVVARVGERALTWSITSELLSVISLEDGTLERLNPAWEKTLGWSAMEMEGHAFPEFTHPDDAARGEAAFAQTQRGEPVLKFENRWRTKAGDWRWLSWVAVPFEGKLYSSARDVTDEQHAKENLSQAEEALRQSQKMEAVGQLTGGVAHDFNNLLTVIRGSTELLKRPGLSDERRVRYIDAIGETADRAAKLTAQLLAFSRRQALTPETFDCGASISDVATMVRTLTGSRIVLATVQSEEPCHVRADRSQFDTAIVNMAINARDAMGGEGRLTITTGPVSGIPALRMHEPVEGDFVAVTIADNGSGIAPEDVARIFEPFFTTKAVGQGTGLGLSQVFGFAKQSGGDIRVESETGTGTTFTLYLPRVAADHDGQTPVTGDIDTQPDGEGLCVLVVEDNEQVGEFAVQALKELGYDVRLAPDGASALDLLAEHGSGFDIIFSDVVMPGMSGLELGQEVRRLFPAIPVILTSGYSHVLAQNGHHGFELLHKPYSIEQLSRVFLKAIAWRARHKAE